MKTDTQICGYAKEVEEVLNKYMDITVHERLIKEKIIYYSLEDKEAISFWLNTDEKWKKTISILQENDMFW